MANTTIPLVILTWLRQLQEHVFKLPDHNSQADWSDLGCYFTQPLSKAVSKGVNHVHSSNATSPKVYRMTSFDNIIPRKKGKGINKVVRSLSKWADKILCRNNEYIDDIVNQSIRRNKYQKGLCYEKKGQF